MSQLTGPQNCAQCGSEFTVEIILAGGSMPATVEIRGHHIPIPGLWDCTGCHLAIRAGYKPSGITLEAARDYLDGIYGPSMTGAIAWGGPHADVAAERLAECLEVSFILEACIMLQDEPGGLDFIPECEGNCGQAHAHPGEMAHLN